METKDILDAPCIFCGYNREGYWQVITHDKHCPWFDLGGYEERKEALRDTIRSIVVTSEVCYKAGQDSRLKEVKEWIERNTTINIPGTEDYCKKWQAFLKGLEGDKK
jgi:hypothetical protein